ncbi:aminotransferase class I/II-fold pyridoxal phosphate-dependent enzyme [Candidatus Vidania fulgoroideorum]
MKEYVLRKNCYDIFLDSMENNFFNKDHFLKNIIKNIRKIIINRYYFRENILELENVLKKFSNTNKNILVGNGLDEIIFFICIASKENIGSLHPTFSMYERYTKILGKKFYKFKINIGKEIKMNYNELDLFLKKNKINSFFLCYPNNPTGNLFNKKKIIKIIDNNPKCMFYIDETYYDFCKKSFLFFLNKYNNLSILRTFSKIGFAALRIGYLICCKKVYKKIKLVKPPYNLSIFTINVVPYIVKYYKFLNINEIIKQRNKLEKFFLRNNIFYYKSDSNFFLVKLKKKKILNLKKNKILVKYINDINYKLNNSERYVRISIGNKIENDLLIKILSK